MNKIVMTTVSVIALSAATLAYAGGACCGVKPGDAAAAKPDAKAACGAFLAKLDLTDAQKAKLDTLKKECDQGGCTEATRTKFMDGLKGILTEEQLTQFKAECHKGMAACAAPATEKAK